MRNDNNAPFINDWLLWVPMPWSTPSLSGEADYLERAACLFPTGRHDTWFDGDVSTYIARQERGSWALLPHPSSDRREDQRRGRGIATYPCPHISWLVLALTEYFKVFHLTSGGCL
jgi:hypothetical protein